MGLGRTGTGSFAALFRFLNYHVRHGTGHSHQHELSLGQFDFQHPPANDSAFDELLLKELRSPLTVSADAPWTHAHAMLPHLERVFPGSRYVLVEREPAEWVRSVTRLVVEMLTVRSHGTGYEKATFARDHNMTPFTSFAVPYRALCTDSEARAGLMRVFSEHSASVRRFFATLPPERSLIMQTSELSNATRLAMWLDCDMTLLASKLVSSPALLSAMGRHQQSRGTTTTSDHGTSPRGQDIREDICNTSLLVPLRGHRRRERRKL